MNWDLRGALLRKGEVESARLADFEFRMRGRTMRLLADRLGYDAEELVIRIAESDDEAILSSLAGADVAGEYERCRALAFEQLKRELGDPTPHRLA